MKVARNFRRVQFRLRMCTPKSLVSSKEFMYCYLLWVMPFELRTWCRIFFCQALSFFFLFARQCWTLSRKENGYEHISTSLSHCINPLATTLNCLLLTTNCICLFTRLKCMQEGKTAHVNFFVPHRSTEAYRARDEESHWEDSNRLYQMQETALS